MSYDETLTTETKLLAANRQDENMPKVSVCIPSYNHAHYIGECIKSVLEQTFDDWDLVIVDNHSSDNTEEVVRTFADPRIRFFKNETNIGPARNWSRCVSLASGDYVAILQSDDKYLPRMLELSAAMLDAYPRIGLTHSSFHRIDSDGNFIDTKRRWARDQVMDGLTALKQLVTDQYITPSSAVMRRTCFHDVGGFDESYRYNLDWSLWLRLALSCDFGYIAEPLVANRSGHSGSLTVRTVDRRPRVSLSEELRLLEETFERLPATREWRELHRQAYRYVMHRHTIRVLALLHQGETSLFRSEIAYAIRQNHRFPLQYRKIMALCAASVFGAGFARWLDTGEQNFWQALRREPEKREPTRIIP